MLTIDTMTFSFKSNLVVAYMLVLGFGACKKDITEADSTDTAFDRKTMLTHMSDNIIVPHYENLQAKVHELDSSIALFNQQPNITNLVSVQEYFKSAYIAWEYCSSFEFGPAEQILLGKNLNTFPTDVNQMNTNIQSGSYNLDVIANWDAKGFPAMDYLLFGMGVDNAAIVLTYTTDASATNRKQYLTNISGDIKSKVNIVINAWRTDYRNVFVNSSGTDIGSSTSYLYNGFVMGYEVLKNYKFSLPLGRMSGQTSANPEKVEAYYSGISTELALAHWNSTYQIWEGKGVNGIDGLGFHEYLQGVEGGQDLIAQTKQQQANVLTAFAGLPGGRLSDAIVQQFDKVDALNTALQKLTRFYKSDMSSLLGISITFNSGDGD
jgi:uncharacterized protein